MRVKARLGFLGRRRKLVKSTSWKAYERKKARERRGIHIGGPGAPDYVKSEEEGEVKAWSKPMGKAEVMREARKGRTETVSKSGFTEEAIRYAEQYRPYLRLIHGKKVVKPRRRKRRFKI